MAENKLYIVNENQLDDIANAIISKGGKPDGASTTCPLTVSEMPEAIENIPVGALEKASYNHRAVLGTETNHPGQVSSNLNITKSGSIDITNKYAWTPVPTCIAENIKNGVTILGVTGEYSGEGCSHGNASVSLELSFGETMLPNTTGVEIWSHVTSVEGGLVTANTMLADRTLLEPECTVNNIVAGKTILGVTGTHHCPGPQKKRHNTSGGPVKFDTSFEHVYKIVFSFPNEVNIEEVTKNKYFYMYRGYSGYTATPEKCIITPNTLTCYFDDATIGEVFSGTGNTSGVYIYYYA